jgi:hypothetical protein
LVSFHWLVKQRIADFKGKIVENAAFAGRARDWRGAVPQGRADSALCAEAGAKRSLEKPGFRREAPEMRQNYKIVNNTGIKIDNFTVFS